METVKGKQPKDIILGGTQMKKKYCVEHEKNDWNNTYYSNKKEALAKASELKALMLNDEIEKEVIWVTKGLEYEDGGYSAEETIWYLDI
jgi:hypothetical protein